MTRRQRDDVLYLLFMVATAYAAWPLDWLRYSIVVMSALGLYLLDPGRGEQDDRSKKDDRPRGA
jgi:hypothetical protein